jgi:hypothetical protein
MAAYYNMGIRKHIYISGSRYKQSEPVLPEVLVMDFGIDNTRCRRLIRIVLEHISKQDIRSCKTLTINCNNDYFIYLQNFSCHGNLSQE